MHNKIRFLGENKPQTFPVSPHFILNNSNHNIEVLLNFKIQQFLHNSSAKASI